ncbi:hypothetical protein MJD09_26300 [bacterium]|nr:hypothetical protein [bacterium]
MFCYGYHRSMRDDYDIRTAPVVPLIVYEAVASSKHESRGYQINSFDFESTMRQLRELGAENVQENRFGIDEISVHILRWGPNVAVS